MSENLKNTFTPQQQDAIAGRGNLLVVAGAGTGKTRTLVARCLRLVEEGVSVENILMVTFTEAAAAEMRGRIRKELHALQSQQPENEHLAQQLALLDTARISTLHGFCLQLCREHFHELALDPQFGVLDDQQTRPLMRLTLDVILETHYSAVDAKSKAVKALIRTVGRGADARVRKLVQKLHVYSQSLPDPARWLDDQEQRFSNSEPTQWQQWFIAAVAALRTDWEHELSQYLGAAPAIKLCVDALQQLPAQPALKDVISALAAIRAADSDKANWPRGSIGAVRDQLEHFFEDAAFLSGLLPDAEGNDPITVDWDWSRHHMAALVSLTREFTAEFTRAKRDLGGVDFADLEQCALRLLIDAKGQPTATAREWQGRFEHVFVDEYQDINAAQDAILTALSRTGKLANRFLVGDVKQSIYRFRRANPHIFSAYAAEWKKPDADGRRIPLTENFRSREALLNFVNPLFTSLMRAELGGVNYEPLQFGTPKDRAALAAQPTAAPVTEFHLIARADDEPRPEEPDTEGAGDKTTPDLIATEREARLVARRLRQLKDATHPVWDVDTKSFRPVEWRDMAVLLRSPGGRAEAFAMEFSKAGIPLVAARDGFFQSLEVMDLINLLKLLDNPLQDVPLAAVLRSPLVGLSLDEMAIIRASNPKMDFWTTLDWWQRDTTKLKQPTGNDGLLARITTFLTQFKRWRELVRQFALSQTLETVLVETNYEALVLATDLGAECVANVHRLLDLARQFDPYQRQGLYRFLRFVQAQEDEDLDLQPAPPATENAVRLMSVHKSKGLEFPVVVLAGLGTHFNEQDFSEPVLLSEQYGLCPKITPPGTEQSYSSLPYWLARRTERRELRGEELRLLYVALTRARDHLILVGTASKKAANVQWESAVDPHITTAAVAGARSHLDWLLLWLPHAGSATDWRDERAGENRLLRWRIYDEGDAAFVDAPSKHNESSPRQSAELPAAVSLDALVARVVWQYPFGPATTEVAKTSVTAIRRRAADEADEEAYNFFGAYTHRPGAKTETPNRPARLSAAERGIAHHLFLELVDLAQTGDEAALKQEARRLQETGQLTNEQANALNHRALAAFWTAKIGQRIRKEAAHVRRELAFTARFSPQEVDEIIGRPPPAGMAEEFVVVQGTADLVVLLPKEIWLVDFKTDDVKSGELEEKVRLYNPQLKLYALALERAYGRPVTERWLHFLTPGETVRLGY